MICATSLSLRTAKETKPKCVTVRSQTSSLPSKHVIFGDRSIVMTRYKSGLVTEIPSPFVGQGRKVTQSPISLGIPVHVPTSEDSSHLWPREPIVGLIVRQFLSHSCTCVCVYTHTQSMYKYINRYYPTMT